MWHALVGCLLPLSALVAHALEVVTPQEHQVVIAERYINTRRQVALAAPVADRQPAPDRHTHARVPLKPQAPSRLPSLWLNAVCFVIITPREIFLFPGCG